ncbi:glycerophosphodiester phosphodiesterase [Bythopirellula polymerisocia]|uniref:Glycerophosphoryl diester phosphodiesterase n=1 Tax=Bythopirellula polymerisocia TaxID=2528003 RepID=A0A5C6CPW3_9BACT|nr:glycerophosphodiester phosphodiesterase family protein [Bythopirellula polymerisocia]TWU26085.1 Glycerophosphoryl diester phosphodiesterase [Bythopirellula polymerisocia]
MIIGYRRFILAAIVFIASTPLAVGRVLVEAHRGYSAVAPENTIASVVAAQGIADLTEFDVRPTSDGVLVVMHDGTVNRTTNGTGSVSSLTLAQTKTLDAGSWFSPAYVGEQVPTMNELMTSAISVGLKPLVERKAGDAQAYHNEFVTMGLATTDFSVISFDWNFLSDMDALDTNYNLGALGSGTLTQTTISQIQAQGVDFLDWNHSTIDQSVVDLVHANGMELHAWTVDSQARMQQLIDFGIDGITTNQPASLHQLVINTPEWADLNGDGMLTNEDWFQYNSGRGVDLKGMSLAEAHAWGDMDDDFDNDIADFVRFKNLYIQGRGLNALENLLSIPEPASIHSVLCGLLAVFSYLTCAKRHFGI